MNTLLAIGRADSSLASPPSQVAMDTLLVLHPPERLESPEKTISYPFS